MLDVAFNPEYLEHPASTVIKVYDTVAQNRSDIAELRLGQAQVSEYTCSKCDTLEATVERLTKIVELMYNSLGIHIRDSNGSLREFEDVSYDFYSLNPKIVFTFQDLMQAEEV